MTRFEAILPKAITDPAAAMISQAAVDPVLAATLDARGEQRWGGAEDLRTLRSVAIRLPQGPDDAITSIYNRILEAELFVVGGCSNNADYDNGTALVDDELLVLGSGSVLLDAQHATNPVRKASGKREAADHGTAGLGIVLAEEVGGRIVIPRGRQTGNANTDEEHPLKQILLEETVARPYDAFFSVHGMRSGKVLRPDDDSEIHAVIGLGLNPTEPELETAHHLVARAKAEYGLRLVVGNTVPHLNYRQDPEWNGVSFRDTSNELVRNSAGELSATRVAALMPTSTVSFMRRETGMPASQLEIARSLRLTPVDIYTGRDPMAVKVGVYLGLQLCRLALETR